MIFGITLNPAYAVFDDPHDKVTLFWFMTLNMFPPAFPAAVDPTTKLPATCPILSTTDTLADVTRFGLSEVTEQLVPLEAVAPVPLTTTVCPGWARMGFKVNENEETTKPISA